MKKILIATLAVTMLLSSAFFVAKISAPPSGFTEIYDEATPLARRADGPRTIGDDLIPLKSVRILDEVTPLARRADGTKTIGEDLVPLKSMRILDEVTPL